MAATLRAPRLNGALTLRQTLLSVPSYMALVTANRQVAQAEVDFLSAQQDLVQRVARQYFAVLQAQDALRAQEAARDAVARQLEQAERRFEVGLIAITDVQEARAARDNANANVIGAKRTVASAEEQMRATIGVKPASLNAPSEEMPLLTPDPASEEEWVKVAMEQNTALISSRLSADIARDTVKSTYGSFVPEVVLSAGKNFSDSDSERTGLGNDDSYDSSSKNHGKSIGLSFSLNLNGLGTGNYSPRQTEPVPLDRRQGTPGTHLAGHRTTGARRLPRREQRDLPRAGTEAGRWNPAAPRWRPPKRATTWARARQWTC